MIKQFKWRCYTGAACFLTVELLATNLQTSPQRNYFCPNPQLVQTAILNQQTQLTDQGIVFTIKNPNNIQPGNLVNLSLSGNYSLSSSTFDIVCTYLAKRKPIVVEGSLPDPQQHCLIKGGPLIMCHSTTACKVTCP